MKPLREQRNRGSSKFPFYIYRCRRDQRGLCTAPPHYHNDIEILEVLEGQVELAVGNERLIATPGHLYFINPEEIHALYTASVPSEYRCFIFGRDLLNLPAENCVVSDLLHPIFHEKLQFHRQTEAPDLLALMAGISDAQLEGGKEIWILADILRLLAMAAPTLQKKEGKKIDDPLRRAIDYMETHYNEKILLPQIAEIAGFNSQYFCNYFKKRTCTTPIVYLTELRIRHAKELLRKTELSITDVAMQCGFENVSFFIQKFKDTTGKTPLKYRKER